MYASFCDIYSPKAEKKSEWEEITNIFQDAIKRKNLSRQEVDRIIDKIFEEDNMEV